MEIIKSYKIRLKPTEEQEILFKKSVGVRRFIYNWCLEQELNSYKFIPIGELRRRITVMKKQEDYKFLNEVNSNVIKQAAKDLNDAYTRYFNLIKDKDYVRYSKETIQKAKRQNKVLTVYESYGYPNFKKKGEHKSFYVNYESMKKTSNGVQCERLGIIKTSEPLPEIKDGYYVKPSIVYDNKYWYIKFGIRMDIENPKDNTDEIIGVDLGIKNLATCSNGMVFENINKTNRVKRIEKRLKRLQRKSSRKQRLNQNKETKNNNKLKKQIALLYRKLTNIREDYMFQKINTLVRTKPKRIIVEDLNIKGMMKNKHLSKAIIEQRFYRFLEILEFKCKMNFIDFVKADRFYPSSKLCSRCGNIKKDLKLKDRIYKCECCGLVIDRDLNASINLANYTLV